MLTYPDTIGALLAADCLPSNLVQLCMHALGAQQHWLWSQHNLCEDVVSLPWGAYCSD